MAQVFVIRFRTLLIPYKVKLVGGEKKNNLKYVMNAPPITHKWYTDMNQWVGGIEPE